MKLKARLSLTLVAVLGLAGHAAAQTLFNFDVARNRSGVVFNAANDPFNVVLGGDWTGAGQWNVFSTGLGNLSGATIGRTNLIDFAGVASSLYLAIGRVNTDGYSDATARDGVWTSYATTTAINGVDSPTITLGGLNPDDAVTLVLYHGHARWSGSTSAEFTFDSVTKSATEALASADMPATEGVTFVRFDNLLADATGQITGTFGLPAGGTGNAVLAGIQFTVTPVPEPATMALSLLGGLLLALRRRWPVS